MIALAYTISPTITEYMLANMAYIAGVSLEFANAARNPVSLIVVSLLFSFNMLKKYVNKLRLNHEAEQEQRMLDRYFAGSEHCYQVLDANLYKILDNLWEVKQENYHQQLLHFASQCKKYELRKLVYLFEEVLKTEAEWLWAIEKLAKRFEIMGLEADNLGQIKEALLEMASEKIAPLAVKLEKIVKEEKQGKKKKRFEPEEDHSYDQEFEGDRQDFMARKAKQQ